MIFRGDSLITPIMSVSARFLAGRAAAQKDLVRAATPDFEVFGPMLAREGKDFRDGFLETVTEYNSLPEENQKMLRATWRYLHYPQHPPEE